MQHEIIVVCFIDYKLTLTWEILLLSNDINTLNPTRIVHILEKAHYDANRFTCFNTYFDRFELNHTTFTSITNIVQSNIWLDTSRIIRDILKSRMDYPDCDKSQDRLSLQDISRIILGRIYSSKGLEIWWFSVNTVGNRWHVVTLQSRS